MCHSSRRPSQKQLDQNHIVPLAIYLTVAKMDANRSKPISSHKLECRGVLAEAFPEQLAERGLFGAIAQRRGKRTAKTAPAR
jgi:hypothetical protein